MRSDAFCWFFLIIIIIIFFSAGCNVWQWYVFCYYGIVMKYEAIPWQAMLDWGQPRTKPEIFLCGTNF